MSANTILLWGFVMMMVGVAFGLVSHVKGNAIYMLVIAGFALVGFGYMYIQLHGTPTIKLTQVSLVLDGVLSGTSLSDSSNFAATVFGDVIRSWFVFISTR